jgi:pyruvate-ferredoxin/flavodoxin oxidoreductase
MGEFKFAFTKPYYNQREKSQAGSGGLYAITVNPYTCKGCMLCVDVCDDDALTVETQTNDSVKRLRDEWEFWQDLPTTPKEFIRIDDLDEKIGALETMLMDKSVYQSMSCGDGACTGCGEKGLLHIFTGTITALMQGRVKKQVEKIDALVDALEKRIKDKLAETVDISDLKAVQKIVDASAEKDLKLADLAAALDEGKEGSPIDQEWLKGITSLLAKLKDLKWRYVEGPHKMGRAAMGIQNAISRMRRRFPSVSSRGTCAQWVTASRPSAWPKPNWPARTTRRSKRISSTSTGPISPTRNISSVHPWWRSVVTGQCLTSASRTFRGP